jgi:co-chaperonin GroES (HSP10)
VSLRMYADNVLLALEPRPAETKGGIQLVHLEDRKKRSQEHRTAIVIASGPGHYKTRRVAGTGTLGPHTEEQGAFIPNETKPGMRVVIDAQAGEDYALDPTAPRHNLPVEFTELLGEVREFRVVREQQVLAVIG